MKKNILITGGTGYIGSHAVVYFEQAGFNCVIVDNLSNSNIKSLDGIKNILGYKPDFFQCDLRDKIKLSEVFEKYNFDGVVHFAGLKSPFESQENPLIYYDNNISGSITLFNVMDKFNVKNIIFSSSANVYSSKNISPISEDGALGPNNPYGKTKQIIEQILLDLSIYSSFNVVNLRYFNPIGCHGSGYIGEDVDGIPNNLLPYVMQVANGKLDELSIFGSDYNTVDGTGVRDYIDVNDLVYGHLLSYNFIESNNKKGFFETFNLGRGNGVSVMEIINTTEKIIGKKIKYRLSSRREGDLGEVFCDPKKAKELLGFETKISTKESIENSWKFYDKG